MLRRAVDVFGFHLTGLDLRQNSDVHALTIGELFDEVVATMAGTAAEVIVLAFAVVGPAMGKLGDLYGRKKLFLITLAVYLIFSFLTAFSWNFWSFVVFRFLAGTGIGGEYSAIYSAVDELIPARFRGQVALAISGSYWIGALMGSVLSIFLLNPNLIDQTIGWRVAFWLGAAATVIWAPAPDRRRDLELVRNLVHGHTRRLARYRCESCGFKARQFHWRCPACGGWETYPPRRTEEFDLTP
jgi:MFS family permease